MPASFRAVRPSKYDERMPRRVVSRAIPWLLLVVVPACTTTRRTGDAKHATPAASAPAASPALGAPVPSDPPASVGSLAPRLSRSPEGGVILSWLEPTSDGTALRWSQLGGLGWTDPATVVESERLLPNSADVPGVIPLGGGRLVAHWRETREPAGDGYDARAALSFDGGRTWDKPVTPHRDKTDAEHGFVAAFDTSQAAAAAEHRIPSLDIAGGGATGADAGGNPRDLEAGLAWIDGRDAAEHPGDFSSQLLATTLGSGGAVGLGLERVVDPRCCDCCPSSTVRATDFVLVAYRDRTDDDVRDPCVVRRSADGEWSQPIPIHADGWRITACPVNGPALDADGKRVAAAWFTAAQDEPRVLLSFSDDAGLTWSEPLRVSEPADGTAGGHAGVALLPDGSALVSFVLSRDAALRVVARRMPRDGNGGPLVEAGTGVVGIPQLARYNGSVMLAWCERTAVAPDAAPTAGRRIRAATWSVESILGH
jgi:hypothetical protein